MRRFLSAFPITGTKNVIGSTPLEAAENASLEVGPSVHPNQALDQVPLAVPRVFRAAGIGDASLMRTLHLDAALLQRQKPFRERFWTLRP
jgi:hypothetical protein